MGLFDTLKNAIPQADELLDKLGLDDKIGDVLEGLVGRLENLKEENRLDDIAQNALTSFKPALEKFRESDELDKLMDKAKDFIAKLADADLPGDLEKLVAKVKTFLK